MTFGLWFCSESVGSFFLSLLSFQHTPKKSLALETLCLQIRGGVHRVPLKMKERPLTEANIPQIFIMFLDKWDLILITCTFFLMVRSFVPRDTVQKGWGARRRYGIWAGNAPTQGWLLAQVGKLVKERAPALLASPFKKCPPLSSPSQRCLLPIPQVFSSFPTKASSWSQ